MKVFIFCSSVALGKGGMEKVAVELANFLTRENVVHLGYFEKNNCIKPAYPISKNVILSPWDKTKFSRFDYKKRVLECLPDIFIYFGVGPESIEIVSLLYKTGVPLIIHEGSNPERIISNNWSRGRKINRYESAWERDIIYSQADAIRFTMEAYKNSVPASLKKRAKAFPNGFYIPDKKAELKAKKIINIGGLKKNKNIKPLLMACKKVFNDNPNWSLDIFSAIAQGNSGNVWAREVKNLITELGLSERVFIRDETDDIYKEYLSSSFHVITSLSEGLSNAVSESMCCGVPSIGVKGVPGVDGLIVNFENGILVDRANLEDELVLAMNSLIESHDLRSRLGLNAKLAANMFDLKTIRKHWSDLIEFAINNNKRFYCEVSIHSDVMLEDFYKANIHSFEGELVWPFNSIDDVLKKLSIAQEENSIYQIKEADVFKKRFLENEW